MKKLCFLFPLVVGVLALAACGKKPSAESAESAEPPAATTETAPSAELVIDAPETGAPSLERKLSGPPIDPRNMVGSYRDPSVPELVYELQPGNTFTATWQAPDGTRGLRIEGLYQVERGEVLYLMGLNFSRKSSFLGGFDEQREPTRKPKCYFRIEGSVLRMIEDRTDAPFKVAPFTATQLVRDAK